MDGSGSAAWVVCCWSPSRARAGAMQERRRRLRPREPGLRQSAPWARHHPLCPRAHSHLNRPNRREGSTGYQQSSARNERTRGRPRPLVEPIAIPTTTTSSGHPPQSLTATRNSNEPVQIFGPQSSRFATRCAASPPAEPMTQCSSGGGQPASSSVPRPSSRATWPSPGSISRR